MTNASLRPLRQRNFAMVWSAALVSNIGSWMQTVAVGVFVTDVTHQAKWTGLVAAAARFFIEWIDREIRFYQEEGGFKKDSDRTEMLSFFQKARVVYVKISERAREPGESQEKARADVKPRG